MMKNIIDDKKLVEKEKKTFGIIMVVLFTILFIFVFSIFSAGDLDRPELQSTLVFIRFFNSTLGILAFGSCMISYNRLKKDDVFIISLMYLGLAVGIIFGQIDYLSFYYQEYSLSNYIIVSTSILRISLLLILLFNNIKIKKNIINNKRFSMIFVILYTILFGFIEKKLEVIGFDYSIEFFILYNFILAIVYIASAIRLFKIGKREKEYLYMILASSILMLSIKAIYAIYGANTTSFYVRITSVSITYIISLIVIIGAFIELFIYINRSKILNDNLGIFYNFTDNDKHSFMFICNKEGKILYLNKKLREFCSSSEDFKEDELDEFFDRRRKIVDEADEIKQYLNEHGTWRGVIKNNEDGRAIDCSIQIINTIGEEQEIAVSYMDISEAISKELELEKLKVYNKEKTEFVSNISHELRTPLNIFYSTLQLLDKTITNEDIDFRSMYKRYRKTLHVNCKRMLRLINNVVDISKIETGILKGKFDNYNIVAVVEDVTLSVLNYAQLKSIDVNFDTNREECIVKCDPSMIERVMLNLLSNAIKFSKENKSIYVDVLVSDDSVEINVKDEGIGISKQNRKAIFERFVQADKSLTRENEGSGIGLSIVKSIVDLHGGYISVESKVGRGSTFKILLPHKNDNHIDYKIYDIDNYNTELELSDIYEVLT